MEFKDPFPFKRVISLAPLAEFWSNLAGDDSAPSFSIAKNVVSRIREVPEFQATSVSLEAIEQHVDLLELMMTAVFPAARLDRIIAAAFFPFELKSIYATAGFKKLGILDKFLNHNTIRGCCLSVEDMLRGKAMSAYHAIVSVHYGMNIPFAIPFVIQSLNKSTGLNRYYRVSIDPTFVRIPVCGSLPELKPEDRKRLMAEPMNLELWSEILPPEHFEFHGFAVMSAVEVTDQEVLSRLKNDLLLKDAMTSVGSVRSLERHLQELFSRPDVRLGLIALDRCRAGRVSDARPIAQSLLLSEGLPACPKWKNSYYARVIETGRQIFVDDLNEESDPTGFEKHLQEKGLRNLFIGPLKVRDEIIGLIELASPNVSDITSVNTSLLSEVTSLFATAMKRSMEEQEDRVQAIIKRQYTAIHPVVEWRFRRAALDHLLATERGEASEIESIVFSDVISLYGMSDIRDSSTIRNTAIREDLVDQLGLALAVIISASTIRPRPSLDEIGYRLSGHIEELVSGLRSEDEHSLILLLQSELEPLFDRLSGYGDDVAEKVSTYRAALDETLGIVYRKRRAYETSVAQVNDCISAFLDQAEEKAQQMIPHYFEKYKTDGVDYNIYAGASLMENGEFDELDLKNLKIWQLMTMAGIVWEMNRLKTKMAIPLETAHLILVQSEPISIRFRVDEKKFDVDGAYNIRYEIIKKRIDKARIAGTSERLTQPGKLAIVYSQSAEAREYERYIEYLQAAGYLDPGIERVELEELQGVHGLRALRVIVADNKPVSDVQLSKNVSISRHTEDDIVEQSVGT